MAMTDASAEQRELALIGKVEMRIALTDSDAKLETLLKTYLAPLLLKLSSEHTSVRNKVISVCQHIGTRIKPSSIQLPVSALVKQFKEQEFPSSDISISCISSREPTACPTKTRGRFYLQ